MLLKFNLFLEKKFIKKYPFKGKGYLNRKINNSEDFFTYENSENIDKDYFDLQVILIKII